MVSSLLLDISVEEISVLTVDIPSLADSLDEEVSDGLDEEVSDELDDKSDEVISVSLITELESVDVVP